MRPETSVTAEVRSPLNGKTRRVYSLVAALAALGFGYGYAFSNDVPAGSIRGAVLMNEDGKPLPHARVTIYPQEDDGETYRVRHAHSGEDGRFYVPNLPAGSYQLSAYSEAHGVKDTVLMVDEGKSTEVELSLTRTQPELALQQHQRVFALAEEVRLPVRGYVDGKLKRGQDRLAVTIYKTRLSTVVRSKDGEKALSQMENQWEYNESFKGKGLPAELIEPDEGEKPQLISADRIPITEADLEGFYFKRLVLGKRDPGLYLVEVGHGEDKTSTWVLVTDMAIVTKQARGKMLAYAVNMTTGTPLAGTTVETVRRGKTIASGVTDSRGLTDLVMPETPKKASQGDEGDEGDSESADTDAGTVVIATRGADEAIVRSGGRYQNEAMGKYAVATYTDRPIYRPGQLIQYKSVVRRVEDPGIKYGVPAGQAVSIELRDPEGDRVKMDNLRTNDYGSVAGQASLSPEARTGVYTLVARVGGEKHTQDFVVASYSKPEYQVDVKPSKAHYLNGDIIEMTVSAEYYFGTPVAGAQVEWNVYSETDWSAEYPDEYGFDPEEENSYSQERYYSHDRYLGSEERRGTIRLDENGKAVIPIPADIKNGPDVPQAHVFTVHVTVKDESNREVQSEGEAHVTAGEVRVAVSPEGYVAEPHKATAVTIIARDLDGKPVANLPVKLESAFVKWRKDAMVSDAFQTGTVTTGADGKAAVMVTPTKSGEVRITASAQDGHGRAVFGHANLWCRADRDSDLDTEYGDLSLMTDKRRYGAGETARVLVNSARTGQTLLLTVEGDRIYDVYEETIQSRSTIFHVPIKADYGPSVTLAACYVKDKHLAKSETILRVTQPEKDVKVEITPDRGAAPGRTDGKPSYHPRDKISYTVKTTDHKGNPVKAELSFGVVDESIYALREDDPALMRDTFYPHRQNNVTTTFSFAVDMLGNANKAEPQITARKDFPDTVYWNPFVRTNDQGLATVSFELKDSLTTWRATAVANTLATTVGRSTNKVLTAKEFFVRVETPRFLTQRDASQIQAIVHNDTGADQTVLLHFRGKGILLGAAEEQTIHVPAGKVGQVVWPVTAASIDTATFDVSVWTPKSPGVTQYTDRVERTIPVRPHGRERYEQLAGSLTPGKEEVETVRLEDGAILPATRMRLRVTDSVRGAIAGALPYLVGYPYGCTEQTMSRVLPDLLAQRAAGMSIKQDEGGDLNRMLRDGMARLSRMQHQTGAWGWWEHDEDNPWMTAYVLYGLGSARLQGVTLSDKMLSKAIEGGKKVLVKVEDRDKPFLLYAMALADPKEGRNTASIVEQTLKPAQQSTSGLAYMILLEKLLGRPTDGAAFELDRRMIRENGLMHWPADGPVYSGWSERMNTAAALRAFLAVDRADSHVKPALHWLIMHRTGDYWECTRDTAWVLTALIDYAALFPEASGSGQAVVVTVNGRVVGSDGVWIGGGDRDRVLTIPATYLQSGKNEVRINQSGRGESFYSLELRKYVGQEGMAAETTAGIKIEREYLRLLPKKAGGDYWTLQTEATNNQLKPGDRIRVRLVINVPKDMEYVLIEDPFPSGCEVTERGTADESGDWSFWYSNTDVRDDRIAFFARQMGKGEHVIEYNLRAQTPGSFHTLPTFVQPMYAPSVRGESAEARVEIK